MPQILMAWEAKVRFLEMTNPFGSGKPDKPPASGTAAGSNFSDVMLAKFKAMAEA